MTIAACYVSDEGVVLGADSTTTYSLAQGVRHLNNAQKLFEVGDSGSTLGLTTWGLGQLPQLTHREIAANLSDSLIAQAPSTVREATERLGAMVWHEYTARLSQEIAIDRVLRAKQNRTPEEDRVFEQNFQRLVLGYCLAGRVGASRKLDAYYLLMGPDLNAPLGPLEVARYQPKFWGMPNFIDRLLTGIDEDTAKRIMASPYWSGDAAAMRALILPGALKMPAAVPLRDAVDWIYSSIFVTIKALKFSTHAPACGGPIEVAAITADRPFRWVSHKGLDQALTDHMPRGL